VGFVTPTGIGIVEKEDNSYKPTKPLPRYLLRLVQTATSCNKSWSDQQYAQQFTYNVSQDLARHLCSTTNWRRHRHYKYPWLTEHPVN